MRLRMLITTGALALAGVHVWKPALAIDAVTAVLVLTALVPWLAPLFKSLELPGGWKVEFAELQKTAQDQVKTTLHQTLATVINWVQAPDVRESRRLLFDMEGAERISQLPAERWQDQWKQAADRVAQAFNSAAIIAQQDERLQAAWIRPSRRTILRSWWIAQPRLRERRRDEQDLWQEFDWLVDRARTFCKPEEEEACTTGARANSAIQPTPPATADTSASP